MVFGDYVQSVTPNILKKSDINVPRTEGCIALLPVGNVQGSVLFFKLSTGRVVTRDHFKVLPVPDEVIQYLNALAAKAKKKMSKEPIFRVGNYVIEDDYHPTIDDEFEDDDESVIDQQVSNVININESDYDDALPVESNETLLADPMVENNTLVVNPDQLPPSIAENISSQNNTTVVPLEVQEVSHIVSSIEDDLVIDPTSNNQLFDQRGDDIDDTNDVNDTGAVIEDESFDQVVDDIIMEEEAVFQDPVVEDPIPPQDVVGDENEEEEEEVSERRYPQRNAKPKRYDDYEYQQVTKSRKQKVALMHLFVHFAFNITPKKAVKLFGIEAIKAIILELKQMLDKEVWLPIMPQELSKSQCKKYIRSFMFLKEKFYADGSFEKIKARLVAGGNEQERIGYDSVASPTVSTTSVFTIAAIAAKESRCVVTLDIGGAYLNARLQKQIFMMLDEFSSAILANIDPSYKKYMNSNGRIVVKLLKALYGCVESALLWYEHLSKTLLDMGFVKNRLDECVFNLGVGDEQCTICLHVDDLFITCKNMNTIKGVTKKLKEVYKEVKIKEGNKHSYTGMNFDFSVKGEVKITMEGYINDVLKSYEVEGTATTPAQIFLFEVREDAELLDSEMKAEFHSRVAKLLYLAKRVRPDILQTIIFLSTRVQAPNVDDWNKLERCLKYLKGEPNLGIILRPNPDEMNVNAYVDASYGVHSDGKSHTGVMIALGDGPIYIRSTKQRIVTKSSTEAELVGLSDACSQIIWCRDFLFEQGYNVNAAKVYQDNKSTMALVERGKGTSDRTKHINIRYFFVKDRVESGDISIEYLPTEEMVADILTKPLQGEAFRSMRRQLLNWYY